jgi:hypothetical protein
MLLRRRPPGIESPPSDAGARPEHLRPEWLAVLRWLEANRVEHVLVGAAARALRGEQNAAGPVAIVPAPYDRNLERLARALAAAHARRRGAEGGPPPENAAIKLTVEKLSIGARWELRCGEHDIDIEGGVARAPDQGSSRPRYEELLYEAGRFQLGATLAVQVAAPEDIEHFDHLRLTGTSPEITITRNSGTPVR